MNYVDSTLLEQIENFKRQGKFEEATKILNNLLAQNPYNKEALLHISDIEYRKGEISKAEKPIDFLLKKGMTHDPIHYYVKGVLEMEKTNRSEAKKYLKEAIKLSKDDNAEILRCFGLCEYWSGNRERGIDLLTNAFAINNSDAEIIYNLVEIYLLEHKYKKAQTMINYFYKKQEKLDFFDKKPDYYNEKFKLFESYLKEMVKK